MRTGSGIETSFACSQNVLPHHPAACQAGPAVIPRSPAQGGEDPMAAPQSHWLVKSEPAKYAFADLQRDGHTVWDGVRNNQAALYLKAMKVGDQVLYYHSQE